MRSGTLFDLPTKQARKRELEAKMGEGGFWDNQDAAKAVVAENKILKAVTESGDTSGPDLDSNKGAVEGVIKGE